jgi:hypothetical protein
MYVFQATQDISRITSHCLQALNNQPGLYSCTNADCGLVILPGQISVGLADAIMRV